MPDDDTHDDRALLHEISQITEEYDALHRRTVRELARTRGALAQAQAVLGTVAHDMHGPLTTVLDFTELLLDDAELTAARRRHCEGARHAAHVLGTLTEELVEAVTGGGSPLRATPVDLDPLVGHVIRRHQLLHPPHGVRVVLEQDDPQVVHVVHVVHVAHVVHGDEARLEQLLDHLVSNAVKFSADGGIVRVSVTGDGRSAEIRVHDDGPGLPADELERIFSPFHHAPGATAVPGVGLGLTIVKRIVEQHGGRVHVESELGHGATFVVRLPLGLESCETAAPLDVG